MRTFIRHMLPLALLLTVAQSAFALSDQDVASIGEEPVAAGVKKSEPPSVSGLIGRVTLAMGVVVGLMVAAVWAAKRWMPQVARAGARQSIEILTQRVIGPRRSLILVRVRGRTLLLGATPQSIQMLTEFEPEAGDWTEPSAPNLHASFEDELRRGTTNLERNA